MPDVTVYCAAPASEVVPHLGDLSQYVEIADENDTYEAYQSLVEMWAPTMDLALERAADVADVLCAAGIEVGISLDTAPTPYAGTAAAS
mgnify:CR=1 FL=1